MSAKLNDVLVVSNDINQATENLVAYLINETESLLKEKSSVTIGLSGASLIKWLSEELLKHSERIKPYHDKLNFIFCDERFVSFDNPDSTYLGYLNANLFSGLNIPAENVYAIKADAKNVEECAIDYEQRIRPLLNSNNGFDILILGVGPDGHTCSLFPGHELFVNAANIDRLCVSISDSPKPPPQRVTLTLKVINNSNHLLFWACGENKVEILRKVLVENDQSLPSAGVKPKHSNGVLKWFIDRDAAKLL